MATPLLLSGPLKVIRDAARAVKRTAGLMIERVTAGTLSTLLGLPGLVVTEYALESQGEREVLHLFGQHEHEVASCPRCGQVSTAVHESEERCIRHLDIWGKMTWVHFALAERGVSTVVIARSPLRRNCLGSKANVGRVRPTSCTSMNSARTPIRLRWLTGKDCILRRSRRSFNGGPNAPSNSRGEARCAVWA